MFEMALLRRSRRRSRQPPAPNEAPKVVDRVVIDEADLEAARRDPRVADFVRDADTAYENAEREGRIRP